MAEHFLDLTHAFKHRLLGASVIESSFASKSAQCFERLQKDVNLGKLPFLNLPFKQKLEQELPVCLDKMQGYKDMLLLGIGGSALGAKALQKAFHRGQDRPNHQGRSLWVADNIDADSFDAWLASFDPLKTVVVVVSKSGATIETMAQYFLVRKWLEEKLPKDWREHLFFVTDENKGFLREQAREEGISCLPVPDNLGGRYSIFSAVGLLPAAFLGIDYKALLAGAESFGKAVLESPELFAKNPAFKLAVWNCELMSKDYSELIFFSYIPAWEYLGAWFCQLWAESLGKNGQGSMPISALGVTDQHSINQMFLDGKRNKACIFLSCENLPKGERFPDKLPKGWDFLQNKQFGDILIAEGLGTRVSLVKHAVPLVHLELHSTDEFALGKTMQLFMLTTILTGWLLEINPIDQPAVEFGKCLANAKLGDVRQAEAMKDLADFMKNEAKAKKKLVL